MSADSIQFGIVQRTLLAENLFSYRNLADIVEHSGITDPLDISRRQPPLGGDNGRVVGHPRRMTPRVYRSLASTAATSARRPIPIG